MIVRSRSGLFHVTTIAMGFLNVAFQLVYVSPQPVRYSLGVFCLGPEKFDAAGAAHAPALISSGIQRLSSFMASHEESWLESEMGARQ